MANRSLHPLRRQSWDGLRVRYLCSLRVPGVAVFGGLGSVRRARSGSCPGRCVARLAIRGYAAPPPSLPLRG